MKVKFDYAKLRGRIVEKYGSINNFSKAVNMPVSTLSLYLNNHGSWSQDKIVNVVNALDVSFEDIPLYFFTPIVQEDCISR